jgi:hypothetical protein
MVLAGLPGGSVNTSASAGTTLRAVIGRRWVTSRRLEGLGGGSVRGHLALTHVRGRALSPEGGVVELGVGIAVEACNGFPVLFPKAGAEKVVRATPTKASAEFRGEISGWNVLAAIVHKMLVVDVGGGRVRVALHDGFGGEVLMVESTWLLLA